MPATSANLINDTNKYLSKRYIARAELLNRFPQLCDSEPLPQGHGRTANFVRYDRPPIPMSPLSEGVTPTETPYTISTYTVTPDQYGLFMSVTDLGELSTKSPQMQRIVELLGDAIARVYDWTIADVLLAGSSFQYWDGSIASRAALVVGSIFRKDVFGKALVTLRNNGAPARAGQYYVALLSPNIEADILNETAGAGFTGYALMKANSGDTGPLEKGTVGEYLGFRLIRSNFLPRFTRYTTTHTTTAQTTGTLATATYYWKIVRRSIQRGFSEEMTIEGSTAVTGPSGSVRFVPPATAGFVYDIYVGSTTGDANLRLAIQGQLAGTVAGTGTDVGAIPTSGATAPGTPAAGLTIHPVFCVASEAIDWVPLAGSNVEGMMTPKTASDSDPLIQRRKVGSKYAAKAGVRDNTRIIIIELAQSL